MYTNTAPKGFYSHEIPKANFCKGFTLAEILISLLILGVIASLTIPSLIQNTHKKEEIVQIKKGLSVINQAIATNYALTGKDLSAYKDGSVDELFKNRLALGSFIYNEAGVLGCYRTIDGLDFIYMNWMFYDFDVAQNIDKDNYAVLLYICTKKYSDNFNNEASCFYKSIEETTGCYIFYCGYDRCVPSEDTAAIINATDPTKVE